MYCNWRCWKKPKISEDDELAPRLSLSGNSSGINPGSSALLRVSVPTPFLSISTSQFPAPPSSANDSLLFEQSLGLKLLVPGDQPVVELDRNSIVAVHGLDGHREKSWTAENGDLWLRDYLPKVLSDASARIFTYGYDGRTYGSTPLSCQTLYDHATGLVADLSLVRRRTKTIERPIIFLAHSIGGIILKSALIHANLTGERDLEYHKAIKISTYGILFFGTPHQGADNFKWDQVFLNIASQSKHTSDIVLKNLGSGSEWLQQQLGQYTRISSHFETKFFYEVYETEHHKLGNSIIVPKGSAVVPGTTDAEAFPIHSDHTGLIKYGSIEDNGFQRVSSCIFLMIEQAPTRVQQNWQEWKRIKAVSGPGIRITFEISFELDYRRNPIFTGRAGILNNLDVTLKSGKSKFIVLHGTGGMGKTQIALEYAHSHAMEYTAVFWVNAATEQTATTSFIAIAQRLITQHATNAMNITGKPEYFQIAQLLGMSGLVSQDGELSVKKEDYIRVIQGVKRWFSQAGNEDWLLIFDNADDLDNFDIGSFMPSSCRGTVIMTSRRRECVRFGEGLEVTVMLEEEAITLLLKTSQLDRSSEDETITAQLTKRLGYLPLSIDQAGAYVATRNITLEKYLKVFEENFKRFSNERPPDAVWSYGDRTAFTTWEISFEAIKSENENAAELLLLCSFFSNEDIWEDMLRRGKKLDDNDLTLGNSLRLLFSYSLAQRMRRIRQREGQESFYVHSMVHEWARERLNQAECLPRIKEAVILLGQAVKYSGQRTTDLHRFEQRIISHIEMILRNSQKYLKAELDYSTEASWMGSILLIVRAYRMQGNLNNAESLELQVAEAMERILGKDHPAVLTAIENLASTYRDQGRFEEAEKLQLQVVGARGRVLGEDDPTTLTATAHLALIYQNQGRWKESEELNLQVLKARKKVLGEDHPDTLSTISNLLVVYLYRGELQKGKELGQRLLGLMERVLGKEHPDTLKAIANLAMIYLKQGELKDAEHLQLQVCEISKKSPGKEHPDTLAAIENLSTIYTEQGRFRESEELGVEVVKLKEKVLGKEHPDTLLSMSNLAAIYERLGKLREVEELQLQLLELNKKVLGKDHPDTLKGMANLVKVYWALGQFRRGEEMGLVALENFERVFGKEHQDTLRVMGNLAAIYSRQGRWLEAEQLEVKLVEVREKNLGKEHPDTLMAMANLAATFSNQKRFQETEELNIKVIVGRNKVLGKNHPDTWSAMLNLASTYTQQGQWDDAEKLQLQVIENRAEVLGDGHLETLEAQERLVVTYWRQGRSKDAEELSVQIVERMENTLGGDHSRVLGAKTNLAEIYLQQERWKEAEELQVQVMKAWKRVPGEAHHSWSAMADLVVTYLKGGRQKEAEDQKQELVEAMEKKLGKGHPDILITVANLDNAMGRGVVEETG